jgi:ribosomal protein L14E/L6E/L27E
MYKIEIKKRINSKKYTPIKEFKTDEEVINYMKEKNLRIDHIPYIFTHIALNNGSIITQTDDNYGLICSPQTLAGKLQSQNLN